MFHYPPRASRSQRSRCGAATRADQLPLTEVVRVLSELWDAKLGNGVHVHEVRVQPQRCRSPEVQGHDADDQPADAEPCGPAGRRSSSARPPRPAATSGPRARRNGGRRRARRVGSVGRSPSRAAAPRIRRASSRSARIRWTPARRLRRTAAATWGESARRHDGDRSNAWLQSGRRSARRRLAAAWLSAAWRLRRSAWPARRLRRSARCTRRLRRSARRAWWLRGSSGPARLRPDGRRRSDGRASSGRWLRSDGWRRRTRRLRRTSRRRLRRTRSDDGRPARLRRASARWLRRRSDDGQRAWRRLRRAAGRSARGTRRVRRRPARWRCPVRLASRAAAVRRETRSRSS